MTRLAKSLFLLHAKCAEKQRCETHNTIPNGALTPGGLLCSVAWRKTRRGRAGEDDDGDGLVKPSVTEPTDKCHFFTQHQRI